MKRRQRLLRRSIFPLVIALLSGLAIGVGVAGLPDPETLNPVGDDPPVTVKPGVLLDPSELTVPPLLLTPSSVPGVASDVSTVATTSTTSTTSTVADTLRSRTELAVMVANGNSTPGSASRWATQLVELGYAQPRVSNTAQTTEWVIYYAEGFEGEAQRLATDLADNDLPITPSTAPLSEAPETDPAFQGQILLVVGLRNLAAPTTTTSTP